MNIERVEHLLNGDRHCADRISLAAEILTSRGLFDTKVILMERHGTQTL